MNIIIVEDEAPAVRRLEKMLQEIIPNAHIIDRIDSVADAIDRIPQYVNAQNNEANNTKIDLIMMDIQLADGVSFEIFEAMDIPFPIIFTTAYDEYALKAFQVNSIGYLLKPINKDELQKSIQKLFFLKDNQTEKINEKSTKKFNHTPEMATLREIIKQMQVEKKEYKNRFLVKIGEKLTSIQNTEIAYFQAEEKLVFLVTHENKRYFVDYSLDDLENQLNPANFFRLNRQFIAQIDAIKQIVTYFNGKLKIELLPTPKTQEDILISREKSNVFKEWLGK